MSKYGEASCWASILKDLVTLVGIGLMKLIKVYMKSWIRCDINTWRWQIMCVWGVCLY